MVMLLETMLLMAVMVVALMLVLLVLLIAVPELPKPRKSSVVLSFWRWLWYVVRFAGLVMSRLVRLPVNRSTGRLGRLRILNRLARLVVRWLAGIWPVWRDWWFGISVAWLGRGAWV